MSTSVVRIIFLWTPAVHFICAMEWYIKEPIISRGSFYDLFK